MSSVIRKWNEMLQKPWLVVLALVTMGAVGTLMIGLTALASDDTVAPTPTPESTLPPTPTPEPTPERIGVRLNEILPAPAAVDWDRDGTADELDEWIELYNAGPIAVDLGGWLLHSSENNTPRENAPYVIPAGTILQPGEFVIFYRHQTGILLQDEGGELRLRIPSGMWVETITFGQLTADASYSRDDGGEWHTGWPPSPGSTNLPIALADTR